jgi:hypothetical protein
LLFFLLLLQIEGHDDDVNTVAFADSTSQILYSGGDDGLCKVSLIVIYVIFICLFGLSMSLFDITFSSKESAGLYKHCDAESSLKSDRHSASQEIYFLILSNLKILYYVKKNMIVLCTEIVLFGPHFQLYFLHINFHVVFLFVHRACCLDCAKEYIQV